MCYFKGAPLVMLASCVALLPAWFLNSFIDFKTLSCMQTMKLLQIQFRFYKPTPMIGEAPKGNDERLVKKESFETSMK